MLPWSNKVLKWFQHLWKKVCRRVQWQKSQTLPCLLPRPRSCWQQRRRHRGAGRLLVLVKLMQRARRRNATSWREGQPGPGLRREGGAPPAGTHGEVEMPPWDVTINPSCVCGAEGASLLHAASSAFSVWVEAEPLTPFASLLIVILSTRRQSEIGSRPSTFVQTFDPSMHTCLPLDSTSKTGVARAARTPVRVNAGRLVIGCEFTGGRRRVRAPRFA